MSIAGERIKYLCHLSGITQQQLADIMGYSSNKTISAYVTGARPISVKTAARFADALNVPVDYVLGKIDTFEPEAEQSGTSDLSALYLLYAMQSYSVRITFDCETIGYPSENIKAVVPQLRGIDLLSKHAKVYHDACIRDAVIKQVTIEKDGISLTVPASWFAYSVKKILSGIAADFLFMQRDYEIFKEMRKNY